MALTYVALDVETAYAPPESICQIGIACFRDGEVIKKYNQFIKPIDYQADNPSFTFTYIHGITPADVANKPTFKDIYRSLYRVLKGRVVVAHTSFDKTALNRACGYINKDEIPVTWMDSVRAAKYAWPVEFSNYKLDYLCQCLNIKFEHHNAIEDAIACGKVFYKCIEKSGFNLREIKERCRVPIRPPKPYTPYQYSSKANKFFKAKAMAYNSYKGKKKGRLYGNSEMVCFTGDLSIARETMAKTASDFGLDVTGSITKKTTILVVGTRNINEFNGKVLSIKHEKALAINEKGGTISILSEEQFTALLDDTKTKQELESLLGRPLNGQS